MESSKLHSLLNGLSLSKLERLEINMPKEVISMDIKKEDTAYDKYEVVFEEVNSFYFINEDGTILKDLPVEKSHLNSIGYYSNGVGEFIYLNSDEEEEEVTDKDISYPNFAIDMKDSSIYIEARSIKINDKKFRVGYPSI